MGKAGAIRGQGSLATFDAAESNSNLPRVEDWSGAPPLLHIAFVHFTALVKSVKSAFAKKCISS